jgi:GT2 family glycosyltransferase
MKNVLVVILDYNTAAHAEALYRSLKPHEERGNYEVTILDNGSDPANVSSHASLRLEKNLYFGGGLNHAFAHFLQQGRWRSLLFLNSDLIVHGQNFVKALYEEMTLHDYYLLSPAVIDAKEAQCRWKQMHLWHTGKSRDVKWIDFQAPLFRGECIEAIRAFPDELILGWGQDILTGIYLEERGWKIGVTDRCAVLHYRSAAVQANRHKPDLRNFNKRAEQNMIHYFQAGPLWGKFRKFTAWADAYSCFV